MTSNIVIGLEDSGVTIQGPMGDGHAALLDRGNTSSGSYVFELIDADDVRFWHRLRHRCMTAGAEQHRIVTEGFAVLGFAPMGWSGRFVTTTLWNAADSLNSRPPSFPPSTGTFSVVRCFPFFDTGSNDGFPFRAGEGSPDTRSSCCTCRVTRTNGSIMAMTISAMDRVLFRIRESEHPRFIRTTVPRNSCHPDRRAGPTKGEPVLTST